MPNETEQVLSSAVDKMFSRLTEIDTASWDEAIRGLRRRALQELDSRVNKAEKEFSELKTHRSKMVGES